MRTLGRRRWYSVIAYRWTKFYNWKCKYNFIRRYWKSFYPLRRNFSRQLSVHFCQRLFGCLVSWYSLVHLHGITNILLLHLTDAFSCLTCLYSCSLCCGTFCTFHSFVRTPEKHVLQNLLCCFQNILSVGGGKYLCWKIIKKYLR